MGNYFEKYHVAAHRKAPATKGTAAAAGEADSATPVLQPRFETKVEPEPRTELNPETTPDSMGPLQQFLSLLCLECLCKKPLRKMRRFQRLRMRRRGVTLPPAKANKRLTVLKPALPPRATGPATSVQVPPQEEADKTEEEDEESSTICLIVEPAWTLDWEGDFSPPESTPGPRQGHLQPDHWMEGQGSPERQHSDDIQEPAPNLFPLPGSSATRVPRTSEQGDERQEKEEQEVEETSYLHREEEAARPGETQEDGSPTAGVSESGKGHLRPCHWVDSQIEGHSSGSNGDEKPESSPVILLGPRDAVSLVTPQPKQGKENQEEQISPFLLGDTLVGPLGTQEDLSPTASASGPSRQKLQLCHLLGTQGEKAQGYPGSGHRSGSERPRETKQWKEEERRVKNPSLLYLERKNCLGPWWPGET